MILLNISEIQKTMVQLLAHTAFDEFLLEQAEIITFGKMALSGKRNADLYDEAVESDWLYWNEVKSFVFSYIKGERTPSVMRISLKASDTLGEKMMRDSGVLAEYLEERPDLNLQIRYEKDALVVVTGITRKIFTMDKTMEFAWDQAVTRFFKELGIAFY